MKGIRDVDNDLAVPLPELLRNILASRKWHSEEDRLRLTSVLKDWGTTAAHSIVAVLISAAAATPDLPSATLED